MARFETVVICLAIALTFNCVKCSDDEPQIESDVKFSVVQNFTEFLQNNPEVELLEPLKTGRLSDGPSTKLLLNYKLGNRISGKHTRNNRLNFVFTQKISSNSYVLCGHKF